jgi:hypothetical protein
LPKEAIKTVRLLFKDFCSNDYQDEGEAVGVKDAIQSNAPVDAFILDRRY